jgi:hypothetical protein
MRKAVAGGAMARGAVAVRMRVIAGAAVAEAITVAVAVAVTVAVVLAVWRPGIGSADQKDGGQQRGGHPGGHRAQASHCVCCGCQCV